MRKKKKPKHDYLIDAEKDFDKIRNPFMIKKEKLS